MSCTVRILGVGSPHGDDQAGWRVLDSLRTRPSVVGAEITAIGQPVELLDHCPGCDRLILIDGCQTGAAPGTVTCLRWPDSRIPEQHGRSTHDLDLASALRLADALGRLPRTVVILGIEVAQCRPETGLSSAVARSLPVLEQRVCDQWARAGPALSRATSPARWT
jgi:hydrogenase maturation protease